MRDSICEQTDISKCKYVSTVESHHIKFHANLIIMSTLFLPIYTDMSHEGWNAVVLLTAW